MDFWGPARKVYYSQVSLWLSSEDRLEKSIIRDCTIITCNTSLEIRKKSIILKRTILNHNGNGLYFVLCSTPPLPRLEPVSYCIMFHSELTIQKRAKMKRGIAENPSRYLHPRVGITIKANNASKHAPIAQNTWNKIWIINGCWFGNLFKVGILRRRLLWKIDDIFGKLRVRRIIA